jgi:secretion/DNA translocation related TadE-like protein
MRKEHGSASLIMIGVLAVALTLMLGAARLGVAVIARGRADTAADAAALAAADMLALGRGPADARVAARQTARDNGAELSSCDCDGQFVTVEVAVGVGVLDAVAHGEARAEVRGSVLGG